MALGWGEGGVGVTAGEGSHWGFLQEGRAAVAVLAVVVVIYAVHQVLEVLAGEVFLVRGEPVPPEGERER